MELVFNKPETQIKKLAIFLAIKKQGKEHG